MSPYPSDRHRFFPARLMKRDGSGDMAEGAHDHRDDEFFL